MRGSGPLAPARGAFLALAVFIPSFMHGCAPREAPARLSHASQPDPAAALYRSQCAGCHGLDGKPPWHTVFQSGTPPDFRDRAFQGGRSDAEMMEAIRGGVPGTSMAGFAHLGEEELRALVGHLRSLRR